MEVITKKFINGKEVTNVSEKYPISILKDEKDNYYFSYYDEIVLVLHDVKEDTIEFINKKSSTDND